FTPAALQPGDADAAVLAQILGGTPASKLHTGLAIDAQLADDTGASFQSGQNVSVLTLWAAVKPGVDPETVVNAIQAQIDLLNDIPPTADEVEHAVDAIVAARALSVRTARGRAELLASTAFFASDPAFLAAPLDKDAARFRAVTPDSLAAVAKTALAKEHRAILVAKPTPPAPAPATPTTTPTTTTTPPPAAAPAGGK
ncbi:MAG TPA: insulinase family protein, partial [Myxococcota bacterium]